jgi:hypothetical protein
MRLTLRAGVSDIQHGLQPSYHSIAAVLQLELFWVNIFFFKAIKLKQR